MRRQLAADDRVEAARSAMTANDVAARDGSLRTARLMWQRPYSGVRVEHAFRKAGGAREDALGFADEIAALASVDRRGCRIAVVAFVGGADQQQLVPRQDEDRA